MSRGRFVLSEIVAHGGATVNGLSRRDGVSHTRDHRLPLPHHDARLPAAEGNYYRTLAPALPATRMLGQWTREVVDAVAERLRTPEALRTYRRIGPLIYTEMSRRMIEADTSSLLAEMSATGVTQAVVVAIDPFVPTSEVLDACRHLPGLLLPFGSCDPNSSDYPERFAQLLTEPIVGVKFHSDLRHLPLDSPRLHVMLRLLAGFPTLTFVCGHSGWDAPGAALRAALAHPNLYLETSWQPPVSSDACATN